jgi:hypothetical protein
MDFNAIKYELQNILCGEGEVSYGKPIQAAANFLRKSIETSAVAQRNEPNKAEETKRLIETCMMKMYSQPMICFILSILFFYIKSESK